MIAIKRELFTLECSDKEKDLLALYWRLERTELAYVRYLISTSK